MRIGSVSSFAFMLATASFTSPLAGQKLPSLPPELAGRLTEDRDMAYGFVRLVKTKWSPKHPRFEPTQQAYLAAQSSYNGCVELLRQRMLNAATETYDRDAKVPQPCNAAHDKAVSFVALARQADSSQSKSFGILFATLLEPVSIFIKNLAEARTAYKESVGEDAEAQQKWSRAVRDVADDFDRRARWKTWEEI